MKLITWNTAGRKKKLPFQFEAILTHKPDFIALQEIKASTHDLWCGVLEQEGYHVTSTIHHYDPELPKSRNNFVMIAAKEEIYPTDQPKLIWPEKALTVCVPAYDNLEITTTHIPPGASNGWIKIETFEGVHHHLTCVSDTPAILCGDFNSPQTELCDGTLVTWGQKIRKDGSIRLARCREQGSRWHDGEYGLLKGLEPYGFVDNYRTIQGYNVHDYSWHVGHSNKVGRRFDHILSKNLTIVNCYYDHNVRTNKLSDHSMMISIWE